jgi:hypothetical protein
VSTDTPKAKRLRGREKRALILDLAAGDDSYDELAIKAGISYQGVAEFAVRNRPEIQAAKRDMTSDLAGIWPTDKPLCLTDAMRDLDEVNELLEDPNLSHAARRGYYSLKIKLRHSIADECGQLPTRTVVQVESAPTLRHEVVGWNPSEWAAKLQAEGPYVPEVPAESDRGTVAESTPDTPVSDPPTPERQGAPVRFMR